MKLESKTWLDFVIVGGQKCGTTTLFRYLTEHPALYMPLEKESPFFSNDEYLERGWDWFLQATFGRASQDKLWGKASPQYMCFSQVPERMSRQIPQVKCIAILRDPVARAYSHYRMSYRRGYERRSFEECVQTQLTPSALEESRLHPSRVKSYVTWGEYGRVLAAYADHFPRDQMLVLFTKDLALNPEALLMRTCAFLEVEPFLPQTLGRKFHQGGIRTRLPIATKILAAIPVPVIRKRFPVRLWRTLERWHFVFEQWNMIPDKTNDIPLTTETLKALQDHYQADVAMLERVIEGSPPWLPFPNSG